MSTRPFPIGGFPVKLQPWTLRGQLTHACLIGLADLTPSGRHGGQRCFLDAFKVISPRLHLCGHLHLAQEHILKDGRKVINVGATPEGSIVLVEFEPKKKKTLDAKLEHLPS